jgi:hypothetical protein
MNNNQNHNNIKKITLSGLLLALTVIILFFAGVVPINKLALYTLSSFLVAVIVIEFGKKSAWIFYIASCLLSLILPMDKIVVIPYVIFFGTYGILKAYIEKIRKIIIEYILKLLYFNLCLYVGVAFLEKLFTGKLNNIKLPWWLIIIGVEIAFIIYDYIYTLFIQYYNEKLKRILKI